MLVARGLPWLLAVLLVLASATIATATIVVPVPDADLIDGAAAIVLGDVTAIESRWDPARRQIFSVITLDVRESLKGDVPLGALTIREPGGRVAGIQSWIHGSPEFVVGERVLLFLSHNPDGTLRVMHLYQ